MQRRKWGARTCALVRTLTGRSGDLLCTAFSPDRNLLTAGTRKGQVKVFDLTRAAECQVLPGLNSPVAAMTFDPEGVYMAAGSPSGSVGCGR